MPATYAYGSDHRPGSRPKPVHGPRERAPVAWYRRPRTYIVAVLAVFVVVTVVTDLPTGQSQSARAAAARSYVSSLESYDASCAGALREAFTLESLVLGGRTTASQRSRVPGLLNDDLHACSYLNQDLFDLQSNLQPPSGSAGKPLGLVNACVVQWEFPDANEVIGALTALLGPPVDGSAAPRLRYWSARLASDSSAATTYLRTAGSDVGASLVPLNLPTPPVVKMPPHSTGGYTPPTEGQSPCLKP